MIKVVALLGGNKSPEKNLSQWQPRMIPTKSLTKNNSRAFRIAVRTGSGTDTGGLKWLLGDHLGSTSRAANYDGQSPTPMQLYKAWGAGRYTSGTLPTSYQFTGQRLETSLGIYDFRSRWYDPYRLSSSAASLGALCR